MITTTIQTTGLDALIAHSADAADIAIHNANVGIATVARQLVRVDTGYTRSTIRVEDTALLESAVIADGAALFLELGWHARNGRPVGPFPFLLPGFVLWAPQVPILIGQYLEILMAGGTLPAKASVST
jgi:hypothetical protein